MIHQRHVPGHPGWSATAAGQVFRGGKTAKLRADRDGYVCVRGPHRTRLYVHALVAEAFHGPQPPDKPIVRHLDGDPKNNAADNLRWGTHAENAADRAAHGRTASGERNGRAKLRDDDVAAVRALLAIGVRVGLLAGHFGLTAWGIREVARGTTWRSTPYAERVSAALLADLRANAARRLAEAEATLARIAAMPCDEVPLGGSLVGVRVGRLRVMATWTSASSPHRRARCACDCGAVVTTDVFKLRQRTTRSCGCLKRDVTAASQARAWAAGDLRTMAQIGVREPAAA